jgi:hypothetical protein
MQKQIDSEIDEQQSVVPLLPEESQQKRFFSQNGSIHSIFLLRSKRRLFAPEAQQIAMQCQNVGVSLALPMVQLAPFKGRRVCGIGKESGHFPGRHAGKLSQEFSSSQAHRVRQPRFVVREIKERAARAKFLSLKKHWRARGQQQ